MTAGTALHRTRAAACGCGSAAAYLVTTHHAGDLGLCSCQRQLGLARYESAWTDAAETEPGDGRDPSATGSRAPVELDEIYVGGDEDGRRKAAGSARAKRRSWRVAVEVRGRGLGADQRLAILEPTSRLPHCGPLRARPRSCRVPSFMTDGWRSYRALSRPELRALPDMIGEAEEPTLPRSPTCLGSTAPSPTSRPGCSAPIAASARQHLPRLSRRVRVPP